MSWFNRRTDDRTVTPPPGAPSAPTLPVDVAINQPAADTAPVVLGGSQQLAIVGESFHQDKLQAIVGSTARTRFETIAVLRPEPDNKYDGNAIAVHINGHTVGHLSRADAITLGPGLDHLTRQHNQDIHLHANIFGGGTRTNGAVASLGVWLTYDPADFGLNEVPLTPLPGGGHTRTGLNTAIDTDLADDSYDLDWINRLAEDRPQRVTEVRELLVREHDPISRHYLFATMESDLYALRETSPNALADYDAMAAQHDGEMNVIRPALIAKFGALPLLETYKQSAIRHAKAADLPTALWWAQRGLSIYDIDALNQQWPDDLRQRIERIQKTMDRKTALLAKTSRSRRDPNTSRRTWLPTPRA